MKRTEERVRCYNCGRLGPRDAPQCPRCGANYGAICECKAELSVYDDECGGCGAAHVPKRVPTSKLPQVRAAKWTALGLVAAATAWVAFSRRPPNMKDVGAEFFNQSDFEGAVKAFRAYTEEKQSDAEGWYYLAESLKKARRPPDEYARVAEKAVLLRSDYVAARLLLSAAELELRHLGKAIAHAEAATRSSGATAAAWQFLAQLELLKPRPHLAAAQRALERARAAGRDTTEVRALLAEITIRMNGARAGGADRLPAGAAATLRAALAGLERRDPPPREAVAALLAKARIHLALGEHQEAIEAAHRARTKLDEALAQEPPVAMPARASAEIHLVRAMGLSLRGNPVEAMTEFHDALAEAPDAATAATACEFLVSADDVAAARALLSGKSDADDPTGAVRGVFAALLLSQNDVAGAAREVDTLAPRADDAFLAEIVGAVRLAQGRFADAREQFDRAIQAAPALAEPHVRRALVGLAESAGAATPAAAEAARAKTLEELRKLQRDRPEFADDALLLEGIGRVCLANGDAAAAREALEAAAERLPADADIWIALAEARRRAAPSTDGDALASAAAALDRARLLRRNDVSLALAATALWCDAGRYEIAISTCTDFLRARPDAPDVLRARAGCYLQLEMWPLAATDLRRLRDTGAAREDDLLALVDALYRSGDQRAAAQAADEAKGKVPAHVLDFLAALHGGDSDRAISRLAGGGPTVMLATVQLAAGRQEDSARTLRAVLKTNPADSAAAALLVVEILGPEPVAPEALAEARALLAAVRSGPDTARARLIEGRILLAEKDAAAAVAPLTDAVRGLPDDAYAALFLGDALFRGGDRVESLVMLRRAASRAGAPAPVRVQAARRLLAASDCGDAERAEGLAREAWRMDIRSVSAAYRIMDLLHRRGDFAQAADVAELALRTSEPGTEDQVKLRFAAAFEHVLAGEYHAAQLHVDALPAALRQTPSARAISGFAELGAGRIDAARAVFSALPPAGQEGRIAAVGLVRCDLARGDRAAAAARVEAWCAFDAEDRDVSMAASRVFQRAGHQEDAVRFAALCAERNPKDAAAAANHATVLRRAGRGAEAVAALKRHADAAPRSEALAWRLAVAALSVQCGTGVPEALASAREVRESAEAAGLLSVEASVVEAEALLALARLAEADSAAQRALASLAEAPLRGRGERMLEARARFVAGSAAERAAPPRRKQAVDEFTRCLEIDRENLDATNNLAWILADDGDAATAARALELARRATVGAPGEPAYWDTRAVAARRAGEFDEAEEAWSKALALLAALPRRDAVRECRMALRCANFLRDDRKKPEAARSLVLGVRPRVAGTSAEREIDAFLSATK